MALSGNHTGGTYQGGVSLKVTWSATQQIENNRSYVTAKVYLVLNSGYSISSSATKNGSVSINGTKYSFTKVIGSIGAGSHHLYTKSVYVDHSSDGSKSFSLSAEFSPNVTIYRKGWIGNMTTDSKSYTLNTIPRYPNKPSISVSGQTRSSGVVNWWGSGLTVNAVSYRLNGGAWTTFSTSGTSGSFTISELGAGTTNSIYIQVRASASSLWSSSSDTVNIVTNHVSYISEFSLSPIFGSSSSVSASYSTSETGGSTTVAYKVNNGGWISMPSNKIIGGLTANTSYNIQLRATNSSGEVEYSPNMPVRTNATPSGSFSFTRNSKIQGLITLGAYSNATRARYRINSGSWITLGSTATFATTPGNTYTVQVELYSSATGLTTILGSQSQTFPALASVSSISKTSNVRNSATIAASFASGPVKGYKWRLSGGSWTTVTTTSTSVSFTIPNLVSNTSYTVEVLAIDTEANKDGPSKSYTFSTKAYTQPIVSVVRGLTYLEATYTIQDSSSMVSNHQGLPFTTGDLVSGTKLVLKFTEDSSGSKLFANTTYSLGAVFKDQYSSTTAELSTQATTLPLPSVTFSVTGNPNISSETNTGLQPSIKADFSTGDYKKKITYNTEVINLADGLKTSTHRISNALAIDLIKKTNSAVATLNIVVEYTEGTTVSESRTVTTLPIGLDNKLLIMPDADELTTTYSSAAGLTLTALLNHNINTVTVKAPKINGLHGSVITDITYLFNGESKSVFGNLEEPTQMVFGPYASSVFNKTLTLRATDSRGLVNEVKLPISCENYNPPSLEVRSIERTGGFSRNLTITGTNLIYSTKGIIGNKITDLSLAYYVRGEQILRTYGNIIPDLNVITGGYYYNETIEINPDSSTGLFATNQTYRLKLMAKDTLSAKTGFEVIIGEFLITTGKALLFLDEKNSEVGVGTTNPKGTLDVDGDSYADEMFSLNMLFFKAEDIEDL